MGCKVSGRDRVFFRMREGPDQPQQKPVPSLREEGKFRAGIISWEIFVFQKGGEFSRGEIQGCRQCSEVC